MPSFWGPPYWVWVYTLIAALPIYALVALFLREVVKPKPARSVLIDDTLVELWVRERKLPSSADAILVPVATDMEMAAGIAKWVRDASGNAIQNQALDASPRKPGEVFIGSGGRYRFGLAALVVVMDDNKRTDTEWIRQGVATALRKARAHDATTCIVPDMTDDLLRQPQSISDAQRLETCGPIARATIEGILESVDSMEEIKIWVWREGNASVWIAEMDRLAAEVKQASKGESFSRAHA